MLSFICLATVNGSAHPVSLNWVKMKIAGGKVAIQYKMLAEDLVYFYKPDHDGYYNYDAETLQALSKKHGQLIAEHFDIIGEDGVSLSSSLLSIDDKNLPDDQVNLMDLMKYEIIYYLSYHKVTDDWEKLYIDQKIGKATIKIPIVTFLEVEADGQLILESSQLADDSQFELLRYGNNDIVNPSELTDSHFMATNSGVRHELTIPAGLLNRLMGNTVANEITAQQAKAYFSRFNKVSVGGITVTPAVQSIMTLNTDGKRSYVYLDLYYASNDYPNNLNISWADFNWGFRWLDARISIADTTYQHTFSRFQPNFRWVADPMLELK